MAQSSMVITGNEKGLSFWRGSAVLALATAAGIITYSIVTHMVFGVVDAFKDATGNEESSP